LVVSAALDLGRHEKTLDPPPQQKWAEEGYAVAQILVSDGVSGIAEQLGTAIAELGKLPECTGNKFGLVGTASFPASLDWLSVAPETCTDAALHP
jgi:carboxymethylenebutenolidase